MLKTKEQKYDNFKKFIPAYIISTILACKFSAISIIEVKDADLRMNARYVGRNFNSFYEKVGSTESYETP